MAEVEIDQVEEMSDENPDFDAIRKQCIQLIQADDIHKADALNILKLFHCAEKKYLEMLFLKQKEIDTLRNELTIVRLTHKNTDLIQEVSQDSLKLQKTTQDLANDVAALNLQMVHVFTKIKK
jgi:hypothetical protein